MVIPGFIVTRWHSQAIAHRAHAHTLGRSDDATSGWFSIHDRSYRGIVRFIVYDPNSWEND